MMDIGPCDGAFKRFYFNIVSNKCEEFSYGGCAGNTNNFLTLKDCATQCKEKNACHNMMDIGPCDAAFKRFYFNMVSNKCEEFSYGGCAGNTNNFLTLKDCATHCEEINVCQQPKAEGPCENLYERYYFNAKENHCEKFKYGGCQGNGNNFMTLLDCMSKCAPRQIG
ncbi:actinia tenebrosa protease inhibitors [Patella vulgata]|uniref:actinia tenebrosa protease inhibitors n=1 Tax=Patella vulgata TaxID=6465 RepID=UPI00218001EA|nr:actinia tenebrosa protease inhibitors [Patella vulgata]